MRKIFIQGDKFGRLLVIKEAGKNKDRKIAWECLCDCGRKVIISGKNLRIGWTKSCGCLQKEMMKRTKTIHGLAKSNFYNIYRHLYSRCNNPNNGRYKDYGGRGIKCFWKSFMEFKDDMYKSYQIHLEKFGKLNTTIDRIDNDGHYFKENCRWATRKEQNRNSRKVIKITFNGKTMSLSDWAEKVGLKPSCVYLRIHRNKWPPEKALITPVSYV